MSNWIKIKKEDIDIDLREKELTFWVNSDDQGNNYVELNIQDLRDKKEFEDHVK